MTPNLAVLLNGHTPGGGVDLRRRRVPLVVVAVAGLLDHAARVLSEDEWRADMASWRRKILAAA